MKSESSQLGQSYDAVKDRPKIGRFLVEVLTYPRLMHKNRSLIHNFFKREFYGRFRGSILGTLWVLIHPIFLFLTYYLVFGLMFNARAPDGAGLHELWYPLYLFTGVLAWTVFAETAVRCTSIVMDNGNLIKKVAFPAQLLPLHLCIVNTIVYVVGVIAYTLIAWATGFYLPSYGVLLLPLVLIVQTIFTMGVGLLLAAVNVFFRDMAQIFPILINLWFFATPVFWYESQFMTRDAETGALYNRMEAVLPFLRANPMYSILGAHRSVLGIPRETGVIPDFAAMLHDIGAATVPSLITFAVGFVVFRSLQHRFADEV